MLVFRKIVFVEVSQNKRGERVHTRHAQGHGEGHGLAGGTVIRTECGWRSLIPPSTRRCSRHTKTMMSKNAKDGSL